MNKYEFDRGVIMKILLIAASIIVIVAIFTYDKWSYRKWYERMEYENDVKMRTNIPGFRDVAKNTTPPKPPMEVHTMFDVSEESEKSHPLPFDTTGLTYDYWGN